MSKDLTQLAQIIVQRLREMANPERAEHETKYFKGTINCFGTGMPALQKLERELFGKTWKSWSVSEVCSLCDILFDMWILEVTLLGLEFLRRFADQMGESDFDTCERWLEANLVDNWATVDSLGTHVLGEIVRNHPELLQRVAGWTSSENRWLRRSSAVTFILPARKGEFLDAVYSIAYALFADKSDDLVQKANGWVLREAGKTDPDRLETFLLAHYSNIPRTTLRYAIEKFPPERRNAILRRSV